VARVKVFVCNVDTKVLETNVTREGERAIDQSKLILPTCSSICVGDSVKILQDALNLCDMVGAYMFQGSAIDESGLDNSAYGCISFPRVDAILSWCSSSCCISNEGIRDSVLVNNGVTSVTGKRNAFGLSFDGVCDHVTMACEQIYDIDQTTQVSMSAWIKTSDNTVPIIAKKATGPTDTGFEMSLDACGRVNFRHTNTATTNELHIRGDTAVNTCVWTHVSVLYNGIPGCGACGVDIYVNGSTDTKGVITDNLTATTLNCSNVSYGAYADGTCTFAGSMDDVNIWVSKKITDEELRSVYNKGITEEICGRTGTALRFNGVDSFKEVPYTTDFDFPGVFDISTWIRLDACDTSIQYVYARRTLSGNGVALAVNRLVAGDIVAEIDGTQIKTCGTCYNDGAWHFVRVYRGTDSVVHLQVNNAEISCSTIASNITLASPALFIGTNHNKTAYYSGDINMLRIYKRVIPAAQMTRLYSCVTSTSIMKFGGVATKIEKEILKKNVVVQSFGKQLGETEVRAEEFNCRSPEFIVDDLIRRNTCLIPHIHGTASGIVLSRFNADGKLIDLIRDLVQLSGKTFSTDALNQFHMHESAFRSTCFVFTHGQCARNFECINDDTEIVNDLVVIGEVKKYNSIECFTGDGCTQTFTLTNGAISSRVLVGGTEQTAEDDYNTCVVNKTIVFSCAPACAAAIQVDYQYELPLLIRGEKQSSIDTNGRHSKRLVMPWIKTRNDGIRFINGYLNRFQSIRTSLKLELGVMKNGLNEGDVVRVVNDIKCSDSSYVVKSLTWRYPDMKTDVLVGEFKFDDLEYEKQIIEKLHDLESAITEIKDIRCSEQLEEILCLTDNVNIICALGQGLVIAETLCLGDAISITVVVPAKYNQGFEYCGNCGVYGSEVESAGYTCSGFTASGFVLVSAAAPFDLLLENGDSILMETCDMLLGDGVPPKVIVVDTAFDMLLECGSVILIENGDKILLDTQDN